MVEYDHCSDFYYLGQLVGNVRFGFTFITQKPYSNGFEMMGVKRNVLRHYALQ